MFIQNRNCPETGPQTFKAFIRLLLIQSVNFSAVWLGFTWRFIALKAFYVSERDNKYK